MKNKKILGLFAIAATFLFVGCSGSVEVGPVPTITPRPTVTPAPTPTPVVVEVAVSDKEQGKEETVYDTKLFKEYYEKENELPELDVAYDGIFTIGLEVLAIDVADEKKREIIKTQFSNISCRTDLSPEVIMDYEASKVSTDLTRIALNFSSADTILKFAQENNLPVRGPELITYETPDWAFTKDLDRAQVVETTDEEGTTTTTIEYASADVMMARMENYIKDVMEYCNTNYPGLIVSWDILDDPIAASDRHELGYRNSNWFQTIGADYMEKACEFARKYATEGQKLFLAQDALDEKNTLTPAMPLINLLNEKGLIDGVAIIAQYNPNSPNVFDMETMLKSLSETGLEIHFTELNVDTNEGNVGDSDKTVEELIARGAKRYKALMTNFVNYDQKKSYDIVNISFEGLTNDTTSLNEPKDYIDPETGEMTYGVRVESYPYFFDADLNVMDTFFAALGDKNIKGY